MRALMDRDTYGRPADRLAIVTGASARTVRRWKAAGRLPATAARLLALLDEGNLGALDAAWEGFILRGPELWTPERERVTPGDVRALHWYRQLADELRRELGRPRQRDLFAPPEIAVSAAHQPAQQQQPERAGDQDEQRDP